VRLSAFRLMTCRFFLSLSGRMLSAQATVPYSFDGASFD
jgi:hypothetical protein